MNQRIEIMDGFTLVIQKRGYSYVVSGKRRIGRNVPFGKLPLHIIDLINVSFLPLYIRVYKYMIGKGTWVTRKELMEKFNMSYGSTDGPIISLSKYDLIKKSKSRYSKTVYYKAKIMEVKNA